MILNFNHYGLNKGWWLDPWVDVADKTFDHEESLGTHNHYFAHLTGNGVLEVDTGEFVISNTSDYAFISGADTFRDDEEWGFELYFKGLMSDVTDHGMSILAFMTDEVQRGVFADLATYENSVRYQIYWDYYQAGLGGCPLYIMIVDDTGTKQWWNGTAWQPGKIHFMVWDQSTDETFYVGIQRRTDTLLIYVWQTSGAGTTWDKKVVISVDISNVINQGGWVLTGKPFAAAATAEVSSFNIYSIKRYKGAKAESVPLTFRNSRPDFLVFDEKVRDKLASFNRIQFDTNLYDGTDLFLPSFRFFGVDEDPRDLTHEVKSWEEGRLDLVSYKYYRTTRLWWALAMINQINTPYNVAPGTILRIPPIDVMTALLEEL